MLFKTKASRATADPTGARSSVDHAVSHAIPIEGGLLGVLLVALLLGSVMSIAAAAAIAQPWSAHVDVGGALDDPYLKGFNRPERNESGRFRWSGYDASISLPGAGAGAAMMLRLQGRPTGETIHIDDGQGVISLNPRNIWREVHLLPRAGRWSGDVRIRILTPARRSGDDPRELGVALDTIVARNTGTSIALMQVLGLGLAAALGTLLATLITGRRWAGLLIGAAMVAGCTTTIVAQNGASRLMLTSFTGRLVLALGLSALLAAAVAHLLAWLERVGTITVGAKARRALVGVATLAFLIRFGGLAYPLTTTSDLRFYLDRAEMVRDGKFLTLFLPNPALTPTQWEVEGPVPRSPLFYVITAPFMFLPGNGPSLAIMAFSSLVDAAAVLLVAGIARHSGASDRGAVYAAALAATLPLGLLLMISWGIFGTLLAQCLALLAMLCWNVLRPRLGSRRANVIFAATLALAYLAYPSALLFLGLTWTILVVLLAARRDPAAGPTLRAGLLAALAAFVLFYGWHVLALVNRTIPELLGSGKAPRAHPSSITLGEMIGAIWEPLVANFGFVALATAACGVALLVKRGRAAENGLILLLAWLLAYPILALANGFVVTFIMKHLLFMLPAIAILGGVGLGALSEQRWGRPIALGVVLFVAWQGLSTEVYQIAYGFSGVR